MKIILDLNNARQNNTIDSINDVLITSSWHTNYFFVST